MTLLPGSPLRPTAAAQSGGEVDVVLRARARELAQPLDEDVAAAQRRLICFSLGEERYAVDVVYARAILPLQDHAWVPVPGTPTFVVGVVNVRGHIFSMMDIARYLGSSHGDLEGTAHVVVVGGEALGMELGLVTDDVPRIVEVPENAIDPVPEDLMASAAACVSGVTQDLSLVLDLGILLGQPDIIVDAAI